MTGGRKEVENSMDPGVRNGLTESWVALCGHVLVVLLVDVVDNRRQTVCIRDEGKKKKKRMTRLIAVLSMQKRSRAKLSFFVSP